MPWLLRMTLVVSLLMAPGIIYLTWRLLKSESIVFESREWLKAVPPILLFSFYLFPLSALAYFFINGDIDVLKYPKPLVYWFWFGLVFVFQLLTWVIIADIIKLITRFFAENKQAVSRFHARSIIILFLLIFCFTGWRIYANTTSITTEKTELSVEGLPSALQGFKIAHISDIQGDEYTGSRDIARYIQEINEINPGLIIFTGDLISYGTDFIKMSARELGKVEVEAEYGIIAVVGDHDFWAGVENVEKALAEEGIPLLKNENKAIKIDSTSSVLVTGITEVYSQASDVQQVDSLMNQAGRQSLKILASHQIADHLIAAAQEYNYSLMLAGHTHGGQIRVPFMGMTFSASNMETEYVSGTYWINEILISINNGLGFTLAPIRYNAPAAISVITLKEG